MAQTIGCSGCAGLAVLLHEPAVMAFVRGAAEVSEPYELFCRRPLPEGLGRQAAWELVSFVRRLQGFPSTVADEPSDFWTVPPSIVPRLLEVVQKTGPQSHLWRELRLRELQPAVTRVLLEDVQAACQRDGIEVDYERLRSVVVHGAQPQTPGERVVGNLVETVWELPGSSQDIGPLSDLIGSTVLPRLARGVDELPGRSRLLSPPAITPQRQAAPREEVLGNLASILDRPETWGDFAFLGQIMASESFFERLPFERCNALVEIAVRHIGFARLGVPALGYAPLSKIRLDWELGLMPESEVFAHHGKALVETPYGIDSTWALCQYAVFFDGWLARMERALDADRAEREARRAALEADGRLNLRQLELLKDLVENPSQSVDVRSYEGRFGVAMSTANTDLARLASLGYLDGRYEGKRQVYRLR